MRITKNTGNKNKKKKAKVNPIIISIWHYLHLALNIPQ